MEEEDAPLLYYANSELRKGKRRGRELGKNSRFKRDVTIFLPAYRESRRELEASLSSFSRYSIPNQDLRDRIEVFIFLDGSTDFEHPSETYNVLRDILFSTTSGHYSNPSSPSSSSFNPSAAVTYDHEYFQYQFGFLHDDIPFHFLVKSKSAKSGKRQSMIMFFDILIERENLSQYNSASLPFVLTLDSDTEFKQKPLIRCIDELSADLSCGAVCGRVRVTNLKLLSPLTWAQEGEYFFSQALDKAEQGLFGSTTVVPGAFSLFRFKALQDILGPYSEIVLPGQLIKSNLLDLGEDRYITSLMIERKYTVRYIPGVVVTTEVPERLAELLAQRRRWINSTLINNVLLLFTGILLCSGQFKRYLFWFIYLFEFVTLWTCVTTSQLIAALMPTVQWYVLVTGDDGILNTDNFWIKHIRWFIYLGTIVYILLFTLTIMGRNPKNISKWLLLNTMFMIVILMYSTWCGAVFLFVYGTLWSKLVFLVQPALFTLTVILNAQWKEMFRCLFAMCCYLLALPLFALILPLFALSNSDDNSWGTREMWIEETTHESPSSTKRTEEKEQEQSVPNRNHQEKQMEEIQFHECVKGKNYKKITREQIKQIGRAKYWRIAILLTFLLCSFVVSTGVMIGLGLVSGEEVREVWKYKVWGIVFVAPVAIVAIRVTCSFLNMLRYYLFKHVRETDNSMFYSSHIRQRGVGWMKV